MSHCTICGNNPRSLDHRFDCSGSPESPPCAYKDRWRGLVCFMAWPVSKFAWCSRCVEVAG